VLQILTQRTSRLLSFREPDSEISDGAPPLDDDESEGSISDAEETPATNQPYLALLQSLEKDSVSSAASGAKRRKLDHQSQRDEIPSNVEEKEIDSDDEEQHDVDLVEEPVEDPGNEVEIDDETDDDDLPDPSDHFETHFVNPDSAEYSTRLKGIQSDSHQSKQFEKNSWRFVKSIPAENSSQTNPPPTTLSGPSSLKLKHRLIETAQKQRPTFDKLEQVLYPITFGYQDLLFCGRNINYSEGIRRMACLHAVNHVFK
jgi:U3 small nucleolar RNA-associated protein 25